MIPGLFVARGRTPTASLPPCERSSPALLPPFTRPKFGPQLPCAQTTGASTLGNSQRQPVRGPMRVRDRHRRPCDVSAVNPAPGLDPRLPHHSRAPAVGRQPPPLNDDHSLSGSELRSLTLAILPPPELESNPSGGPAPPLRRILPAFLTRSFPCGTQPCCTCVHNLGDIVESRRHLSIREMLQFCAEPPQSSRRESVRTPRSAQASRRDRVLCRDVTRIYAERPAMHLSVQRTPETAGLVRKIFSTCQVLTSRVRPKSLRSPWRGMGGSVKRSLAMA